MMNIFHVDGKNLELFREYVFFFFFRKMFHPASSKKKTSSTRMIVSGYGTDCISKFAACGPATEDRSNNKWNKALRYQCP